MATADNNGENPVGCIPVRVCGIKADSAIINVEDDHVIVLGAITQGIKNNCVVITCRINGHSGFMLSVSTGKYIRS